MQTNYDLVVVGAGHAGCEAALVAAKLGKRVACVTFKRQHVGRLSCNPAVGGQAKGQLVREIDALGGWMGRAADAACIQFRRLNTRKGLAVQSSRAQVDISAYPANVLRALLDQPRLTLVEAEVTAVRTRAGRVAGVELAGDVAIDAPVVILTTGTFLRGVMHRGEEQRGGGRVDDPAAVELAGSLAALGLRLSRLKTGTVPRLDAATVAWDRLARQEDTLPGGRFSFGPPGPRLPQVDCYVTYTNPEVHALIHDSLHRSPMATGAITGTGPRYCPSIEDKVVRFADRERHLLFLEPEGLDTNRIYVNGFSTSLPKEVQLRVIHGIQGLEHARILEYGYAVEYDCADPRDLGLDLQHRGTPGLYLAGQINGTSGYEEAAAQGLIAGISAATGGAFHVKRTEGYLGVLVDDLVTKGIGGEPYRMFTSRAEHRLLLREDNADRRLMPRGREMGLIDDETWNLFERREIQRTRAQERLDQIQIRPTSAIVDRLKASGLGGLRQPTTAAALLARPGATWDQIAQIVALPEALPAVREQIEIDAKYGGYIAQAERRAREEGRLEAVGLPQDWSWLDRVVLSTEVKERVRAARPQTLGQLARLPGVTPAAVGAVAAFIGRASPPA